MWLLFLQLGEMGLQANLDLLVRKVRAKAGCWGKARQTSALTPREAVLDGIPQECYLQEQKRTLQSATLFAPYVG